MHPVVKYVLRDNVPTPISQIYSQFPNHSRHAIRATLSTAVQRGHIKRTQHGTYSPPDHIPAKAITLETIHSQIESLQYHVAQETIKQIKATLSKLPTSKHDHKDIQRHVGFAAINGTVATLNSANSILSHSNLSSLYFKVYEELPSLHQPYFLAFVEHYGKIEPHKDPDPKILAEVQAWMESMAT